MLCLPLFKVMAQKITNFSSPPLEIRAFYKDAMGKMFVFDKSGGVYKYENQVYTSVVSDTWSNGETSPNYYCLGNQNKTMYVIMKNKVYCFLSGNKSVADKWEIVDIDNTLLNHKSISSLELTKQGNLICLTDKGILIKKGKAFEGYSKENGKLLDNRIRNLYVDKNGKIWVCYSNSGIVAYDENMTNLNLKMQLDNKDIVAEKVIGDDKDGNIYFASRTNDYRFDGKQMTENKTPIRFIIKNNMGNTWGINYREMYKLINNEWVKSGESPILFNVFEDNASTFYALDYEDRLRIFTEGKWNTIAGIPQGKLSAIRAFNNGNVAICSYEDGISFYDGKRWQNFNALNVLPDNSVNDIVQDKEGNYWVATNGGLCKYSNGNWETFTDKDGIPGKIIQTLFIDKNDNLWVATREGVAKKENGKWKTFGKNEGLTNSRVVDITMDNQGAIWVAIGNMLAPGGKIVDGGVSKFDGTKWTNYTTKDSIAHYHVSSLVIDDNGNVLASTKKGISKFNGTAWTTITTKDGLPTNSVNCIYKDTKGNIWAGTENGLAKLKDKNWVVIQQKDGLISNNITSISEINGILWIATNKGISKLEQQ